MPRRISMIGQVTTNPTNRSAASPHSGGWSESLWFDGNFNTNIPALLARWVYWRTSLLPIEASVVGFRLQNFVISGNKLIPGTTQTFKIGGPGAAGSTDQPQVSLELSGVGFNGLATNRFRLGVLPDAVITSGEYQPVAGFDYNLQGFIRFLLGQDSFANQAFGFVGRELGAPVSAVVKIAAGVVTVNAPQAAINVGDYVRLKRVRDVNGNAVQGLFRVDAAPDTLHFTLQGLSNTVSVTTPSGSMRKDLLTMNTYQAITVSRSVSKKIGRPSQGYRGRRSRQTV